ncbi:MAG: hypothetical protein HY319_14615 [Armatimonadetes bacterium]|nr:hypothetical protein [Armatimonadota bacterium]
MFLAGASALATPGVWTHEVRASLDQALHWLLWSGIQSTSPETLGAINAYYDADIAAYPYAYPEATGYALTLFVDLHRRWKRDVFLERARSAADWISGRALIPETGRVLFRHYYDAGTFSPRHAYAFDTGIILAGFANLLRVAASPGYRRSALEMGFWLTDTMQKPDGSLHCAYDLEEGTFVPASARWSQRSGPFHTKVAAGLLNLAEACGEASFERAARRLCDWAVARQSPDGRFLWDGDDSVTRAHPHCYACEGLLYAGVKLGESRYREAAARGIGWLLRHQRPDGSIPAEWTCGGSGPQTRMDAIAQTLRLVLTAVRAGALGRELLPAAPRLLKFLLRWQSACEDPFQRGGFSFLAAGQRHSNSWATMFAIQAMGLWLDMIEGGPPLDWNALQ